MNEISGSNLNFWEVKRHHVVFVGQEEILGANVYAYSTYCNCLRALSLLFWGVDVVLKGAVSRDF